VFILQEAIFFNSVIEDNIIRIPEMYKNIFKHRVLVAVEIIDTTSLPAESTKKYTPDNFTALKLDTKNWKFDRDEANERC
jgi:hypothetical protein